MTNKIQVNLFAQMRNIKDQTLSHWNKFHWRSNCYYQQGKSMNFKCINGCNTPRQKRTQESKDLSSLLK